MVHATGWAAIGVAVDGVVVAGAVAAVVEGEEGTVVDVEVVVDEMVVVLPLLADVLFPEQAPTTSMPATASTAVVKPCLGAPVLGVRTLDIDNAPRVGRRWN